MTWFQNGQNKYTNAYLTIPLLTVHLDQNAAIRGSDHGEGHEICTIMHLLSTICSYQKES